YCVVVPFWDEWDGIGDLVEKMAHGTLSLEDLFAQHNEHRIFFPRLITLPIVIWTHWNTNVTLYVSWLLACLSSFSLYRVSRLTCTRRPQQQFWRLLGINVLLFTSLQHESWLWGFQLQYFLVLACFNVLLWLVTELDHPARFIAAIVCC